MLDLVKPHESILTGNDNIVIRKYIDGIEGGRDLDVSAFKAVTGTSVVHAGHVIIKTTANGATTYKPMPVQQQTIDDVPVVLNGEPQYEYAALPASHSYAGFLVATIDAATSGAGIMTRGKVNKSDSVMPYSITGILTALKAALPLIEFMEDAD